MRKYHKLLDTFNFIETVDNLFRNQIYLLNDKDWNQIIHFIFYFSYNYYI